MAQLTVYIDDQTRGRIEQAADKQGISVSKWVALKLRQALRSEWPAGYETILGSLGDADLERPSEPVYEQDAKRECFE